MKLYVNFNKGKNIISNTSFKEGKEFTCTNLSNPSFTAYVPEVKLNLLIKALKIIANENLSAKDCEDMAVATLREVIEGE